MIKKRLRKYAAIAAMTVVSAAFSLVACAIEPKNPTGKITMTTKAAKVEFHVVGTGDITIDWGDGKRGNQKDAFYDEPFKQFVFTHQYSGATLRYIAINGKITRLSCSNNELTALDVSGSTELTILECGHNQLTGLDVSKNTALEDLRCANNQLTGLDLSKNTALRGFTCSDNVLTSLTLSSANTALGNINCTNNRLTGFALNELFRALPDKTTTKGYEEFPEMYHGFIRMIGNPGDYDCDWNIATEKGWRFIVR